MVSWDEAYGHLLIKFFSSHAGVRSTYAEYLVSCIVLKLVEVYFLVRKVFMGRKVLE